jgi:hypothetical protein
MKVRNGFVSNSSSSSFIIHIREQKFKDSGKKKRYRYPKGVKINGRNSFEMPKMEEVQTPLLITKEQFKALKKHGFKFGKHLYASRLEEGVKPEKVDPKFATHMYFQVVCNEAEEVEFLVKHGIPFEASTHYGHYSVFFQRGKDRVYIARNYGRAIETYKSIRDEMLGQKGEQPIRSQTVKSILKEGWTK